jgi:hypothetical protein
LKIGELEEQILLPRMNADERGFVRVEVRAVI